MLPIIAALLLAACAGRDSQSELPGSATLRDPDRPRTKAEREAASAPALRSVELTVVNGGTFGPYIGRGPESSTLVWSTSDAKGRPRWYSLGLPKSGAVNREPLDLAPAPEELSLVVVRPTTHGGRGGFVAVAAEPGEHGRVHVLQLGAEGQLEGVPVALPENQGTILWVDAVATARGPLVFWAVSVGGLAEVYAARIDAEQTVHEVTTNALAWQLTRFAEGAALATVRQNGVKRDVLLKFVDETGKANDKPLVLRERSLAQLDLDMANVDGHLVVAWSEQQHLEPALFAAAVDPSGLISHPAKRLTAPMGEQALVRLVSAGPDQKHGFVLWENVSQTLGKRRVLQVAPLLASGELGNSRATVAMYGDAATLPEFAPAGGGLAVLTQAPMCLKPPEPCDDEELVPAFVRFDRDLEVLASEPLRLDKTRGAAVDLAWGLGCNGGSCTTLAAPRTAPAPIYWVELAKATNVFAPVGARTDDSLRPRLAANEALQEVDPLSDLAVRRSGSDELVTWVTYFDPTLPYEKPKVAAPDGRFAPVQALLQTLHTRDLASDPTTISLRARSLGGVALAESASSDFLLGWTAIDAQVPQVFLTLVSATGAKKQLKMLTRAPGEKSDAALARLDDGWAVGWVDERHQDPEIYAVKVGNTLTPVAPEQRLTSVPGGASDLALLALGDRVLLAWGDTRASKQQGFANVFTRLVQAKDLAPLGSESAIERSPGHAHSIRLGRTRDGVTAAWIESRGNSQPPVVKVALLNGQGRALGEVRALELPATNLGGLAMECTDKDCRLIVAGEYDGTSRLWAAIVSGAEITHRELTTLTGSPTQEVTPAIAGESVFLAEQSSEGQTRVRRLYVQWP